MRTIDSIAVFVAVVRQGTLSGAASVLGLPRSTVTRRIAALEDRLSVRLLDRTTRSVRVTQAGRRYYEEAAPLLRRLDELEEELSGSFETVAGLVRTAMPVGVARDFFAPMALAARQRLPDIRLEVVATDRRPDLLRDNLDLMVWDGPLPDSSTYRSRRFLTSEEICVAAPAYLTRTAPLEKPDDLAHHDSLFRMRQDLPGREWPLAEGGTVPIRALVTSTDGDLLHSCALQGLGIALLPRVVVAADLAKGALKHVLPQIRGDLTVSVVWADRSPPARVRAAIDFLVETGERLNPLGRAPG